MWRPALCTLATISTFALAAQDGVLHGMVTAQDGGATLIGVNVTHAPGQGVATGMDGRYELQLPPGEHTITFSFIGYATRTEAVTITPGGTHTLDLVMQPATAQLEMVVVSAGRFEQRVVEITQSLSVIRPDLLYNKNITSLDQALDQVPGVIIVDEEPQIRAGSGFSYGAGSRVQVLVDNIPILSGDIGRPNWSFLPIESMEQVEVVKGAASVLHGSAALSGVINMRTAYPRAEPTTRVTSFMGVYDAPGHAPARWWRSVNPMFGGASFMHAQQFGRLDLVVGGNAFTDAGYIGPDTIGGMLDPAGYSQRIRFNTALRWRSKVPGLAFGVNANAMKSRSSSVFIWDNVDNGLFRPEPNTVTYTLGEQYYIDPFITYHTTNGFRHELRTRFHGQGFDNTGDQSNSNRTMHAEYQVQQEKDLLGPTMLTGGAVVRHVHSQAELYRGNEDGSGRNEAMNLSAFLQVDKKLFKGLLALSAGVRYEQFEVNGQVAAQPVVRGGATYQLFEGTFLRASYGQGFRFPTIGERFINTNVGSLRVYPNPDLQAETSWNLEGGIKQGFRVGGFQGYADVVVFQQAYDRFVEFTFGQWAVPSFEIVNGQLVGDPGLGFKSVNTGGARVTGIEMEAVGTGKIGAVEITMLAGYTHTLPVSTTPDSIYGTPAYAGIPYTYNTTSLDPSDRILKFRVQNLLRADLQAEFKRLSAGASVRYNSHVRNIDKVFVELDHAGVLSTGVGQWMKDHQSGDTVFDARVGWRFHDQVRLAFIVNNLTNTVYSIRPLAIEAPRHYQLQLFLEV